MTPTLPKSSDRIVLPSIRWETYRAIASDLETQPSKRLTNDNGLLEFRMPSELHQS